MADVLVFVPRIALDTKRNLEDFIAFCKNELSVFGRSLDWDSNRWPESHISFGNLDQKSRILRRDQLMQDPFLQFAKAYHRYVNGMSPTSGTSHIAALRCIERALVNAKKPAAVESINLVILDAAAVICREAYGAGRAYHVGRELGRLTKFLTEKRLVAGSLDWVSPIPRADTETNRTGPAAQRRREKKLPSEKSLSALAMIFADRPTAMRDIVTSSTCAMLLGGPSRACEVLALPVHCEVEERTKGGEMAYGWSFIPAKGGAPAVKWVPEPMVPICKEAIARIKKATDEGRRLSAWLEDHPDLFYRHEECPRVGEDEPLSADQVAKALGLTCSGQPGTFLWGLKNHDGVKDEEGVFTLRILNRWVHTKLPRGFPWIDKKRGLKFRDALFCMRALQMRPDMNTSPVKLKKLVVGMINHDLGYRRDSVNIFGRNAQLLGGETIQKITTHQFRHYLNTLAQRGGMAQSEIARWSGRADPRQNRVYDQMSEFELSDKLRSHDPKLSLDAPLVDMASAVSANLPRTRDEFNILKNPVVHVTEIGFCVHDYVLAPCELFRDCINCAEQVCVKGDRRLDRLKDRRELIITQLTRAEGEAAEGVAGADRWYEVQRRTLERVNALIAILEDPRIAEGSMIRLRDGKEFNPLKRALAGRESTPTRPRRIPTTVRLLNG